MGIAAKFCHCACLATVSIFLEREDLKSISVFPLINAKTREVAARISVGGAGPRRLGRQCGPEKRWWGRQCWSERCGPRKRWRGRMRPRRWRLPSPSTTTCSSPSSCHRTVGAHECDTGPIQLRCDCTSKLALLPLQSLYVCMLILSHVAGFSYSTSVQ